MSDLYENSADPVIADLERGADIGELPSIVTISQAFAARLPAQRVIDQLQKLEPGIKFAQIMEDQPGRVMAFRALMRDHPRRDPTSLWMHAYDCEVELENADPTQDNSTTP